MEIRRQILKSRVLNTAIVVSVALLSHASAQTNLTLSRGSDSRAIRRVFLNVTGDPKLRDRLMRFFELEIEDTGIEFTNTEADADSEVDAEVKAQIESQYLGLGVMSVSATVNGRTETSKSCESLGTPEDGEFFASSTAGLANRLRANYPSAKTVRLDPGSDMAVSKVFEHQIPASLKESNFTVTAAVGADVTLRIDLTREKVPVEENVVKHKITVTLRDGSQLLDSDGSGVVYARAINAPALCPDRVNDLDWLSGSDPLFQLAERVVKQLRQNNRRAAITGLIKK